MTLDVVYVSRTGNTAVLAEKIEDLVREMAGGRYEVRVRKLEDGAGEEERDCREEILAGRRIFAGFWTDRGDCSKEMACFLESLRDCTVFVFGTAGSDRPAYQEKVMARALSHLDGSNRVPGTFMCQGKMLPGVRRKYEALAEKEPGNERVLDRIRNFDRAETHPDQEDLRMLERAVRAAGEMFPEETEK